MNEKKFRWLHLSDIHVGANHLAETWPRFNTIFLDDIARKVELDGPIDTIVISGDLVQLGAKSEFDRFDEVAENIISRLGEVQDIPQIVTVPGNHDLSRAEKGAIEGLALKQYWNDDEVRGTFWSEDRESLRQFVNDRFETYRAWREDSIKSGRHMAPIEQGLLVGDSTYQLEKSFGIIGLVCLNSTWLQLTGGNYDGQLHVDAKQLLNITGNDADSWCQQNEVNLLITHQPSSWFKTSEPTSWANDINPPGRFDFHLFGHMHEPIAERSSVGGGLDRRSMQAASLFGLQTFGPNKIDRIQGYSSNEIRIDDRKRVFTSWPRRLTKVTSGALKLVPDSSQDIDEATGSFSYDYEIASRSNLTRLPEKVEASHNPVNDLEKEAAFDAQSLAVDLVGLSAHRNVRLVEQDKCAHALQENKVVWLVSDWGMGKEGFIASVVERVGVSADHVFSIDLGEYAGREAFFEGLKGTHGASLNQICDAFSELKNTILVLDDIDVQSPSANGKGLVHDVEELSETIVEYAPEIRILIRSRQSPVGATKEVVELEPFDEAEVALYAKAAGSQSAEFSLPENASLLFRHTDGVPTRVDGALSDLEFMTIQELISLNSDYGDRPDQSMTVPNALVRTVEELQRAEDPNVQRAYRLLMTLTALPRGDSLAKLKRVFGPHPIFPTHARQLTQRSLISSVSKHSMGGMAGESATKLLVVSRPVREYVRQISSDVDAAKIDRQLTELFFGSEWRSGSIRNSQMGRKLQKPHCDDHDIQNSSTLIYRELRRAILTEDQYELVSAVALSLSFIKILVKGDHFRSAASMGEDIHILLGNQSGFEQEINQLQLEWASALRMTGCTKQATEILEDTDFSMFTKSQRQSAELDLALCYESLKDKTAASEAAKRIIAINKHGSIALQAKAILAEQLEDQQEQQVQLQKLLTQAKKQKSWTMVSNLLLTLAGLARSRGESDVELIRDASLVSVENKDYYNSARAIVRFASSRASTESLSDADTSRLIAAYHYLYNERLFNLFEKCHAALWRVFEEKSDIQNLLRLFRRSSFLWRLNNLKNREKMYLEKLQELRISSKITLKGTTDRDGVYFLVRATVVLKETHKTALEKA